MTENRSVSFFDEQFRHQPRELAQKLNPFEELALPYLWGDVLDFGCGLGNLAFAAAARGCTVTALDASQAAIEHIRARTASEGAAVAASLADLRDYPLTGQYDSVVSIGLLMFFDCPTARKVLSDLQLHVRPGGVAVINVLVEGTTYLDMFDPSGHCLFTPSELQRLFTGWSVERSELSEFESPHDTLKRFCTVVARKPAASNGSGNTGPATVENSAMTEATPQATPTPARPELPDHLSVDPRSPHHVAAIFEHDIGIRFNGKERHDVEEYCISERWIRVPAGKTLDRKGKPLLIKLRGAVEAFYK